MGGIVDLVGNGRFRFGRIVEVGWVGWFFWIGIFWIIRIFGIGEFLFGWGWCYGMVRNRLGIWYDERV